MEMAKEVERTSAAKNSAENTRITLEGELHYGLLEKLLSGSIHGIAEKMLEEDVRNIERRPIES